MQHNTMCISKFIILKASASLMLIEMFKCFCIWNFHVNLCAVAIGSLKILLTYLLTYLDAVLLQCRCVDSRSSSLRCGTILPISPIS